MSALLSYVDLSQKSLWIAVASILFVRHPKPCPHRPHRILPGL